MAYTDVPSAVGTLRPAAAPRLALAAPQPDRRRALELLAASRDGCTEALMVAHGLGVEQMVELIRDGLAAATTLRITDAGRRVSSTKRHQ